MPFLENFNYDFGTIGIGIAEIRLTFELAILEIGYMQILVNLTIISVENNRISCFLCHPFQPNYFNKNCRTATFCKALLRIFRQYF